jgi:hypothetical protein
LRQFIATQWPLRLTDVHKLPDVCKENGHVTERE